MTIRDTLMEIDAYLECLGAELVPALDFDLFDPDKYFTKIDGRVRELIEILGFDDEQFKRERRELVEEILNQYVRDGYCPYCGNNKTWLDKEDNCIRCCNCDMMIAHLDDEEEEE